MGLLDRLRRPPSLASPNVTSDWAPAGYWQTWPCPRNVVRESQHQDELRALVGPMCEGGYLVPVAATLRREPDNPHDANAIRVEVDGRLVGRVRREVAAQLAPALDRRRCPAFVVCGVIRGGSRSKRHLGLHLWLERRLSDGPEVDLEDGLLEVSWPPTGREIDRATRRLLR
jgi:HIRAN domain